MAKGKEQLDREQYIQLHREYVQIKYGGKAIQEAVFGSNETPTAYLARLKESYPGIGQKDYLDGLWQASIAGLGSLEAMNAVAKGLPLPMAATEYFEVEGNRDDLEKMRVAVKASKRKEIVEACAKGRNAIIRATQELDKPQSAQGKVDLRMIGMQIRLLQKTQDIRNKAMTRTTTVPNEQKELMNQAAEALLTIRGRIGEMFWPAQIYTENVQAFFALDEMGICPEVQMGIMESAVVHLGFPRSSKGE